MLARILIALEGFMRVEQISILIRNEPGVLSKILESMTNGDINILGLTINETAVFGELRLIVDDMAKTKKILEDVDVSHNIVKVIVVNLPDKPGELLKIARLLSDNDINIDYMYTLSAGRKNAFIAIKSWDMAATEELLLNEDMEIVSLEDIIS